MTKTKQSKQESPEESAEDIFRRKTKEVGFPDSEINHFANIFLKCSEPQAMGDSLSASWRPNSTEGHKAPQSPKQDNLRPEQLDFSPLRGEIIDILHKYRDNRFYIDEEATCDIISLITDFADAKEMK